MDAHNPYMICIVETSWLCVDIPTLRNLDIKYTGEINMGMVEIILCAIYVLDSLEIITLQSCLLLP